MEEEKADLISELPDSLLHHILCSLDMVNAVQTCVLSKRWRYLCTSIPCLYFDEAQFLRRTPRTRNILYYTQEFLKSIDKVISDRNRSKIAINTFRICLHHGTSMTNDDIVKWINVVVQCNVVVLDITIRLDRRPWYIVLPHSLLNSKSLETLSINLRFRTSNLTLEQLPNSMDLPALKTLCLRWLSFRTEDINNLISKCPVLETLIIHNCRITTYNLIINAPKLKHLRINLSAVNAEREFAYRKIIVFAPNLISFRCREERMMGDYSMLNNASSVMKAEIDLLQCRHGFDHAWDELLVDNVKKCLAQISKVKALYLTLSDWLFQAIFVPPAARGCNLHITFYSLTILKLETWVREQQTQARSYLLEMCPNLETLVLHIREGLTLRSMVSSVDEEFLLSKLPLECMSRHLKFVEIQTIEYSPVMENEFALKNEFTFIKFLLENALVLETLNFHHEENCENSREENCENSRRVFEFVKEVKTITRASPNVKISLLDWSHEFKFW